MKIFKKSIILLTLSFLCITLNCSHAKVSAASNIDIAPYSIRDSLPIKYEIWYSYKQGAEYRNYVYRDFTYANGYERTDTYGGRIELTPLDYEFYSKAELWTVSYSFH